MLGVASSILALAKFFPLGMMSIIVTGLISFTTLSVVSMMVILQSSLKENFVEYSSYKKLQESIDGSHEYDQNHVEKCFHPFPHNNTFWNTPVTKNFRKV